ncbi:c-type cytochrome biogenesis protein CcmI [Halomonas sp. NO4]|uniref:c-type cytochrome biogenesis protein CcmI n=1 Tax=Halomonas sp. NO4 TaxID=2484813 RepID=UPI0013D2B370|nr:c-type cytochrome biogenesis protein CcmI [Halomonas sp. NO4]
MILMWLAFAILLLPALWLLVAPLRRAAGVHDAQRDFEANDRTAEQNVAIYRRRLESLEAARERGELDQARFDEDRLELERSLLDDTADLKRRPLQAPSAGRFAVPVVALALVAVSVAWYQQNGAEGDLALHVAYQESESLPVLVERLEAQAARQPDNPNVWSSLFPLYRDTGQSEAALEAINELIRLEGRQPSLLAQKAQLKFFMADRTLTDEVQALVDEILERDSSEPTTLGMLGVVAFDRGNYQEAIDQWRRAIAGMNDPNSAEALREGIRMAQQRLGVAPEAQEPVAAGPGIQVRVSLADDLQGSLADDTLVYVVARDMAGELPPLAVTRVHLGELPTTLVLDDRHAMSEQASISQVDEVRVIVRVTTTGDAEPVPGDLFGRHEGIAVGDTDGDATEVVVDRVVE